MSPKIIKAESDRFEDELLKITQEAYDQYKEEETFYVGVSGGSLPPMLIRVLKRMQNVNWDRWLFFFCDERCVPSASEDSTFGAFRRLLEKPDPKLPLSLSQFITIDASLSPSSAARDYLSKVRERFGKGLVGTPKFNILFLGLGPDGHTCSLFPNHPLLKETKWIGHLIDSPKPPSERISMTYSLINNARLCLFVVTGKSKASVVKEILENKQPLPAALVNPVNGYLIWLLDTDASSELTIV